MVLSVVYTATMSDPISGGAYWKTVGSPFALRRRMEIMDAWTPLRIIMAGFWLQKRHSNALSVIVVVLCPFL
jgi:hypothetical protein